MLREMNIVFLVLASNTSVNEKDQSMQMMTWAKTDFDNIKIIWVRGKKSSDFSLESRQLFVPVEELYENILQKTVIAAKWIAETYNPDYLIRTNVSTYFELHACEQFLRKAKNDGIDLLGYPEVTKIDNTLLRPRFRFISGAGIIMSRNAIQTLSYCDWTTYKGLPDDVALSHHLEKFPLRRRYISRSNLGYTRIFFPGWFIRLKSSENFYLTQSRYKLVDDFFASPSFSNFWSVQWNEIVNVEFKDLTNIFKMIYVSFKRWMTIKFQGL